MIPLPVGFKIISEEGNRGVYDVPGLYPGYGHTIGNSIRRVLLSSLRGSAITAVKIKGVSHEFSAIPNVLEDAVEIMLNLKHIRFKMAGEGPYQATLSVKGERAVTAGDIVCSGELSVVSPDVHIATLTSKDAELDMEFEVSSGFGYQTVEARKKEKVDIGSVALDAAFSPVRLANFEVENMRVGDRTDYNKIRFTVETDGSITPQDALMEAARILTEQFRALSGFSTEEYVPPEHGAASVERVTESTQSERTPYEEKAAAMPLSELKLSNRTHNALAKAGLETVGDISSQSENTIRDHVRGLGDKGIVEIKKALGNLGLTFKQ